MLTLLFIEINVIKRYIILDKYYIVIVVYKYIERNRTFKSLEAIYIVFQDQRYYYDVTYNKRNAGKNKSNEGKG